MRLTLFTILAIFLSASMAFSQSQQYISEISYYQIKIFGEDTKFRQEKVYRMEGNEKKLVGERNYFDKTNELRQVWIQDENGQQFDYGIDTIPNMPLSQISLMKEYFSSVKTVEKEQIPEISNIAPKENSIVKNAELEKNKECDPENKSSFMEVCGKAGSGKVSGVVDFLKKYPDVKKRLMWQGTDHPGYQLIDCSRGTILNVIEKSGERYFCSIKDYKKDLAVSNSNDQNSSPNTPNIILPNDKSYDPDTCEWVEDMPRRIAHGPSCNVGGSKVCVGYVVCKQKETGLRMIRMSTCSEDNCGELDAIACTRELGFYSSQPKERAIKISKPSSKSTRTSEQ